MISKIGHDPYSLSVNLLDTLNLVRCGMKKATKAIIKPVNTFYATAALAAMMSFDEVQGQNNKSTEITQTAYGNLFIKDENDQGVEGATITWTPVSIPGDSIPDPYTFTSNSQGTIAYENILVFHDTGVSVTNNNDIEVIQARPNPSTDFTFNFIASQRPDAIQLNDVNGKLVGRYGVTNYDNQVAVYHVDLSDKANGIYFATASIDGKPQVSKIVKINRSFSGNVGSSAREVQNSFKSTQENEAIYDILIQANGYFDLTDQRILTEGDQGWGGYTMTSNAAPPIDNLDIEGYVWKLENTDIPLANALVKVKVLSTGEIYSASSSSNGRFVINDLPLDEEITFAVGGVNGRYSFNDVSFTTPSEIINPSDSLNSNFGAVLPLKLATSSANHIRQQVFEGTNQDIIKFYFGNSLTNTQKNTMRNYFNNLQSDEDNVYVFVESPTQLINTGINIEMGTYNTNTSSGLVQTPLGETLYPVIYSNTTMGTSAGYYPFVHEIKRALGFSEVAWDDVDSVMETPVQDYTQEDKDIARFIERPYWNAVYQNNKTWINLNNIAEDMNLK